MAFTAFMDCRRDESTFGLAKKSRPDGRDFAAAVELRSIVLVPLVEGRAKEHLVASRRRCAVWQDRGGQAQAGWSPPH